ncbi:tyrosine-protein phosphatase [Bacillus rubiinfantis]|uniref:tyrosine-protein phosphatase n=1 Tax=Bacillus rubiinfantis TaxID=1499680 RepID=UPI0005A7D154|nr:CpsB/CapC family capsule biosynthesis tyrosine phosphatase [Bacillus rubiinfantis]
MVDIHCHILPGVDDGAQDVSESIRMAQQAIEQGIQKIVATPHHRNNQYENPKETIIAKIEELNAVLKAENLDVTILPGQEVRIYGEMLEGYEQGEIQTVNGTHYVLVEFPSNHVPRYTDKLFYDMQLNGILPVIVHPERNQEIIERPETLYQLVKKGAIAQVTAASVSGHFGKKIKQFSLELIEANLAHVIASDAHNTKSRGFKMQEAYETIKAKFGNDMVYLLKENAELLIEGQHVYKQVPERIKKKKLFKLF